MTIIIPITTFLTVLLFSQFLALMFSMTYYKTTTTTEWYHNIVEYDIQFSDGHQCVIAREFSNEVFAFVINAINKIRPYGFMVIGLVDDNNESKKTCSLELITGQPYMDAILTLNLVGLAFGAFTRYLLTNEKSKLE